MKQLWGPLSSWGFRRSPPHIGQTVLALEDSGCLSSTSGSEGQGQVAPNGKGILDQFSRPFQGSEHLPQTDIHPGLAGHLASVFLFLFFSFSCQPPFGGQSCRVASPGHNKDRWAAGSSAQSHTRNHSFVSHFRVIIELLVERVF